MPKKKNGTFGRTFTLQELMSMPERKPRVKVTRKGVTITNEGHDPYEFATNRTDDPMALLNWVHHLCGKNWMDLETVEELIEKVCVHFKWLLHPGK